MELIAGIIIIIIVVSFLLRYVNYEIQRKTGKGFFENY